MHKVFVKTAHVEPARWKIKLTLSFFLPFYVYWPDVLRLSCLHFPRRYISPFKRHIAFRVHQNCFRVGFFHMNTAMVVLSWWIMQNFLRLGLLMFVLVFSINWIWFQMVFHLDFWGFMDGLLLRLIVEKSWLTVLVFIV